MVTTDMRRVSPGDIISLADLRALAQARFGDMVKGVVDLRPSFGNRSRGVDDPATRDAVTALVNALVRR